MKYTFNLSDLLPKISAILILGLMAYFSIGACTNDGVKTFYCLSDDECVTVWKRPNGEVYIIPGKYKGDNEPAVSYVKTNNKQFLTLYFSQEFPQQIIIRDEGNLEGNYKGYSIENRATGDWQLSEYSEDHKRVLYMPGSVRFKDVKAGTDYLTINLPENHAIDKSGKKHM